MFRETDRLLYTNHTIRLVILIFELTHQSKEEGKAHESIQSNTTPDLGQHMGKWKTQENITYKGAKRPALSQQVPTRLPSMINTKHK